MALEREMIDAQNTYLKLQQDIQELNARRSKLQNEIEEKIKETEEKIKLLYADYEKKVKEEREALDKQVKETNALLGRTETSIVTQEEEIKGEWGKLEREDKNLQQEKSDFEAYKESENRRLNDRTTALDTQQKNNVLRSQELDKITKEQADTKYYLDNLKFQADYSMGESKKLLDEIVLQQAKVDEKYQTIKKEKDSIAEEVNRIEKMLEELKVREEGLRKLASVKEDIAKFEALKIEVEAKLKQNEELSKGFAKRKEELDEREQTLNEKQRLLILDMRKNDEKIAIIQKLRDEMKKNA